MDALREVLFAMLVYVPIFCAIVQLYCWSRYTLKGAYLRKVQASIRSAVMVDV